eukprot:346611-Hanusia_phi.AAC.1
MLDITSARFLSSSPSSVLMISLATSGLSSLLIAARLFPYILAMSRCRIDLRHLDDDGAE